MTKAPVHHNGQPVRAPAVGIYRCGPQRRRASAAFVLVLPVAVSLWLLNVQHSGIRPDERVVLFPTFGHLASDDATWVVEIHGWIFEPETDSAVRAAGLKGLRHLLGLDKTDAQSALFTERALAFLVDNERGKRITAHLAGRDFAAGVSEPNGHFRGIARVPIDTAERLASGDGWLSIEAAPNGGSPHGFTGKVQLISRAGLSVISDIDDTIRISHVLDRKALMKSTFLREFEAVPGMAELYQEWAANGARFHYVSGSPWQFYEPLAAFLSSAGYPAGTFHLRNLRLKDLSAVELLASPGKAKQMAIERILQTFPRREFILVGDSGEQDPEIYGAMAAQHTEQVARIVIRDVTGEPADRERYRQAFAAVPPERWMIFERAEQIGAVTP